MTSVSATEPVNPDIPQYNEDEEEMLIGKAKPIVNEVIGYLIDRFPMFAQLILERLRVRVDFKCYAAWTNGVVLAYNPGWVVGHTILQVAFLFAHEIMHNLMCHTTRRENRSGKIWNVAGDYAINSILLNYHVGQMPDDALLDIEKYDGNKLLTEQIYDLLLEEKIGPEPPKGKGKGEQEGSGGGGQGHDPLEGEVGETMEQQAEKHYEKEIETAGKFGEVRDWKPEENQDALDGDWNKNTTPDHSPFDVNPELPVSEEDLQDMWEQAETRAAISAKQKGWGRMELHQTLQAHRVVTLDWKDLLREFMKSNDKTKRSYTRIDPRLINA